MKPFTILHPLLPSFLVLALTLTAAFPLGLLPPRIPNFGQVTPTGHHNHSSSSSSSSPATGIHLPGHRHPLFPPVRGGNINTSGPPLLRNSTASRLQRVPADLPVPRKEGERDHRRLPLWWRPGKHATMTTRARFPLPTPTRAPRGVDRPSLVASTSASASASVLETPTVGKPVPGMPKQGELSWGYVLEPTSTLAVVKCSKPVEPGPWATRSSEPIRPRNPESQPQPESVRIVHSHLAGGGPRAGHNLTSATVTDANSTEAVGHVRRGLLNNLLTVAYGALSNGVGTGIKNLIGHEIEEQIVCTDTKEVCDAYAAEEKAHKEDEEKEKKEKEEKKAEEKKKQQEEKKKQDEEKKKQQEEKEEKAIKAKEKEEKHAKQEKEAKEREREGSKECTKMCTGKTAMCPKKCAGKVEKEERRWIPLNGVSFPSYTKPDSGSS
ncbi:MAG: hypothetical protein Q9187_007017 [Circinaria calcarea]